MALWMTTMLLLLFLIAAVASVNAVSIVGVGKHIVKPDGTVTLADRWNVAASGTQPRGYKMYGCPIEIKANGDITVRYTKSGGGKNGCGLDLIAKKPVNDAIRFTIAIDSEPNMCVTKDVGMPDYSMLPFIHSVDNQEFQRMSKGGGWFGPDKGNCSSKNDDAKQCKNKEGKYQCRKYTTYEFGWSMEEVEGEKKPLAFVKPVGEPMIGGGTKAKNYFYLYVPFQPHTLIVTSKQFEVEFVTSANINDEEIKRNFKCTPDAKLYPVISWTIANGEGTPLNGRHLLFFGLLAQDTKRDYFMSSKASLPLCDFSLTFKGEDYELLHQQEFIPTQTIPATNQTEQPTNDVLNTTDTIITDTATTSAPADDMLLWILLGVGGALALMAIGGVLIYCMCFKNRKDDDERERESKTDKKKRTSNSIQSQTGKEDKAATAYGRTATTAFGRTVVKNNKKKEKKATMVDKDNNQKNQLLDGSKGIIVPLTNDN